MKRIILILVLLLLTGYLLTGLTVVRPGERAVVRRFGRVLEEQPSSGLHVGLPWGMDQVDRVPVDLVQRVLVGYQPGGNVSEMQTPPGQLLTGDHNLVNIQVAIVYSVKEDEVTEYVIQSERIDGLVARAVEGLLTEWVASRTVDDVLLNGKATLPAWLVQQTRDRLAPYRLGIRIHDEASVTYLYPPDEVRDAFDKVTRAQTDIRTAINAAEQERARRVRQAQSDDYRSTRLAEAYREEQVSMAEAEAESFEKRREQYHRLRDRNPAFLTGIWWDEMSKLFTQMQNSGRIDILDNHLGRDGLDITVFPPMPRKK